MAIDFIVGLLSTLVVGLVSIIVTLLLSKHATDNQNKILELSNSAKQNQIRIQDLISRITGLFSVSQRVGIEAAYENREVALSPSPYGKSNQNRDAFVSRIEIEKKLIVVGSSILGLRVYVEHLPVILRSRSRRCYETKILLTHPCFSGMREKQEGRERGQIEKEIEETLRYLKDSDLDLNTAVRFYCGTPTCFTIITSEAMLLNPYPYQIEAFRSFCLEVRRMPQHRVSGSDLGDKRNMEDIPPQIDKEKYGKEFINYMNSKDEKDYDYRMNIGPDIYGQFYWYHYLLPWFSPQAVTYGEYCETCKNCDGLKNGYDDTVCAFNTHSG